MILKSITCPACGGRNFTLEEVVEDDDLTGVDLNCARGCGFYTYEAGDRSAWNGLTIDLTAQSSVPQELAGATPINRRTP